MEDIKEAVTQVLEKKGILARLRAELRANVFLAIDEADQGRGGGLHEPAGAGVQVDALSKSPEGQLLIGLVRELLQWCNLNFTLKVFEPEVGLKLAYKERDALASQLGLPAGEAPLLLQVLKRFMSGEGNYAGSRPVSSSPEPQQPSKLNRLGPLAGIRTSQEGKEQSSDATAHMDSSWGSQPHPSQASKPTSGTSEPASHSSSSVQRQEPSAPKAAAPPSKPAPPPVKQAPPPPAQAPPIPSRGSFDNDLEIEEDDDDLAGAEIEEDLEILEPEDEEDVPYTAVTVSSTSVSQSGKPELPKLSAPPASKPHEDFPPPRLDLSLSDSMGQMPTPGRLRPNRSPLNTPSDKGEDLRSPSLSQELLMSGDRSPAISHELTGYSPSGPPPPGAAHSLSMSEELSRFGPDGYPSQHSSPSNSGRISPPLSKLEPLGSPLPSGPPKLGKLSPLSPLGPLVKDNPLLKSAPAGLAPLKEDPLLRGKSSGLRASADDIKEELRRQGLLSDSFSTSPGQSMDIPDSVRESRESNTSNTSPPPPPVNVNVTRSLPSLPSQLTSPPPAQAPPIPQQYSGGNVLSAPPAMPPPKKHAVYDDELDLSATMEEEEVEEVEEEEEDYDEDGDVFEEDDGVQLPGLMHHQRSLSGKGGVSMDFKETGLSASDRSGELEYMSGADLMETADL